MGKLSHGVCFDNPSFAAMDYASRAQPFSAVYDGLGIPEVYTVRATTPAGSVQFWSPITDQAYSWQLPNCNVADWEKFDLFNLSVVDGGLISGAVLGIWFIGFGIRALIAALNTDGDKSL